MHLQGPPRNKPYPPDLFIAQFGHVLMALLRSCCMRCRPAKLALGVHLCAVRQQFLDRPQVALVSHIVQERSRFQMLAKVVLPHCLGPNKATTRLLAKVRRMDSMSLDRAIMNTEYHENLPQQG